VGGTDLPADLDPVHARGVVTQPDVQDSHIGLRLGDEFQGLLGGARLSYDRDIFLGPQQIPDAPTNQFVVVQQKDTD
jgi:hypothetical protein